MHQIGMNVCKHRIPSRVRENTAFWNAPKNSDLENARIEHDKVLQKVMNSKVKDDPWSFNVPLAFGLTTTDFLQKLVPNRG